ncbi:MAG: flagellar export protein FliJ [Minwuia sp.]|nr:flagellar export protein FliJ [Minwuia sp.]
MSTLDKLLQVSQLELDRRRHEIGELHAMRDDMQARSDRIDGQINAEKAATISDPMAGSTIGAFINAARHQQQTLAASMAEVDTQIDALRDVVAEAFRETKRYEKLIERKREERRRAADRREQVVMDEIGLRQVAGS